MHLNFVRVRTFRQSKLTNQVGSIHPLCQGSLLRPGLKQRLRDYPGCEVACSCGVPI